MDRAVIYARFSSDMQREESIEAQVRACREYAKRKGYVVTHIYKDEAKSAKTILGRDEYNNMLLDAEDDLFDVIIFHKIDRNARNEFDYFDFKRKMTALGIRYEYAAQNIDYSPEGQMMENMLVGFAAYYSRNLAKEVKKGMNENAYKAKFNGGVPPFGYDVDQDNHYVINPQEAEAVRMIFDMYLDGKGYPTIISALNAKGYRTKNGNMFGKNSIFDMLRNEKYIGVYIFNRVTKDANGRRNTHGKDSDQVIRIEDALPPIIDRAIFMAAQKKMKTNRGASAKLRARETYLLTGRIFCSECGSAMNGHRTTRDGKGYVYYVCSAKDRHRASCPSKNVRRDELEDWIISTITTKVFSEESIKTLSSRMQAYYVATHGATEEKLQTYRKALADNEAKLERLLDAVEKAGFIEELMERILIIRKNISELKEKISDLEKEKAPELSQEQIDSVFSSLKNLLEDKNNVEAKKILVNLFVAKVSVGNKKISAEISTEIFSRVNGAGGPNPVPRKLLFNFQINREELIS